jgi:hypothetical protein
MTASPILKNCRLLQAKNITLAALELCHTL